jgi:hypothetical protein
MAAKKRDEKEDKWIEKVSLKKRQNLRQFFESYYLFNQ